MLLGAHVDPSDPLRAAEERNADLVQFFLGDPQGWRPPPPRADAAQLRASELAIYIHAPYVVNLASLNNRIRIPSRKILADQALAAAALGARGLIVHGGHVGGADELATGIDNWRKTFERFEPPLPILIENTAGGSHAMARRLDALARLWDALERWVTAGTVGFCLDTCHAHAGGEELLDLVERVTAITGRVDLVHANDSKDGFDSGRDRHENLGQGRIDPAALVAVVAAAGAPVVCETPGGADGQAGDIAFLREQLPPD
jgi:deoxyribonuclease-4